MVHTASQDAVVAEWWDMWPNCLVLWKATRRLVVVIVVVYMHLVLKGEQPSHLIAPTIIAQSSITTITNTETFSSKNDNTLFNQLASLFENAVIRLLSSTDIEGLYKLTLKSFQRSYASSAFRCRFSNCSKSFSGFASAEIRN